LIAPLYGGKSAHDVLAAMSDRPERSAHDMIREFWKVDKDERTWRRWLHDGIVPNSAFPSKTVTAASAVDAEPPPSFVIDREPYEINFRNDPSVLDGRFANNGWLQELPKPITRLTW